MTTDLKELRERFIDTGGQLSQSVGLGRVTGQIFAYLYFSEQPQTLDDLTRALHISKGAASMSVRQLEQWGAVRKVWVKGRRKDYIEATEDFGRIIRRALLDLAGRRAEMADGLLAEAEAMIADRKLAGNGNAVFIKKRIKKLRTFRDRAQSIWDSSILKLLLK